MKKIYRLHARSLLFLIAILPIGRLEAQQKSLQDSLLQELNRAKTDTQKVFFYNELAQACRKSSKYDAALEYAAKAKKIAERIAYKKGLATSALRTAYVYWEQGRIQEALSSAQTSLDIFRQSKAASGIADASYCLAVIQIDLGNYPAALNYYKDALKIYEQSGITTKTANTYEAIGVIQEQSGNYTEALRNYETSLLIRKKTGDLASLSNSYNNIGIIFYDIGNYSEALKSYFNALTLYEKTGNRKDIGSAYLNIANVYASMKQFPEALHYFSLALQISKDIKDLNGMALAYTNIGILYRDQNKFADALSNHLQALELHRLTANKTALADDYDNLGQTYASLKNHTESLRYFSDAKAAKQEIGDLCGLGYVYDHLGSLYYSLHQYESSRKSLDSAGNIFNKIHSKPGLEQNYAAWMLLDSACQDYHAAFTHSRLYMTYHDSLFNEENTKKAVRAEMSFNFDKKQAIDKAERMQADAVAAAESKKQRIILISVSIMLLLILGFAVYAYRNYRLKLHSNILLEIQKKNIEDSINYARRIQEAILPKDIFETGEVCDHVLLYRPRDIVSGDFYWRFRDGDELFIAVLDCTGHGVPGAMMSMLGYDLIEYAVKDRGLREPADILNLINKQIIEKLKTGTGHSASDGMDITLCRFNLQTHRLVYSGAGNDLLVYSGDILYSLDARGISIGYSDSHNYEQHTQSLLTGDMIWLFTDGYRDQNGGPENKKLMLSGWKSLLLEISPLPCPEQKKRLISFFENWKGNYAQRDDVLVLGIRI